jgi:hypothetical protein
VLLLLPLMLPGLAAVVTGWRLMMESYVEREAVWVEHVAWYQPRSMPSARCLLTVESAAAGQ